MYKNNELISMFLVGREGRARNLTSYNGKLKSYDTVIAEWVNGDLLVNDTKYSNTTTKIQNDLRKQLGGIPHIDVRHYTDIPINCQSLKNYEAAL